MKIIKWFLDSASKNFELNGIARRFFSIVLIFLWAGGLIYVIPPVFEGLSAIPMYRESSRLEHDETYIRNFKKREAEIQKLEGNRSLSEPRMLQVGERITKYDAGLRDYSSQMSVRKHNSWKYITDGATALFSYVFFCFLFPWSLIRGTIYIIKG